MGQRVAAKSPCILPSYVVNHLISQTAIVALRCKQTIPTTSILTLPSIATMPNTFASEESAKRKCEEDDVPYLPPPEGEKSWEKEARLKYLYNLRCNVRKKKKRKAANEAKLADFFDDQEDKPTKHETSDEYVCGTCNVSVPARLWKRAEQRMGKSYETTECPNCEARRLAQETMTESDRSVLRIMTTMNNAVEPEWPEPSSSPVPVRSILEQYVPGIPQGIKRDIAFVVATRDVYVRHLRLGSVSPQWDEKRYKTEKKTAETAMGGSYPNGYCYPDKQCLSNPGDGTIGLVSWSPKGTRIGFPSKNYAMIDSSNVRNEDIVAMSHHETSGSIVSFDQAKRQSTAAGFLIPPLSTSHDPIQMTVCTKDNRVFLRKESSNSTYATALYINRDSQSVEKVDSVYNDIHMARYSKAQKRRQAEQFASYRRTLCPEMESRLRAKSVLAHYGIEQGDLWKSVNDACARSKDRVVVGHWKAIDPTISQWQIFLLEYGCSTGEMRNHQALKAHTDGNKRHTLESMTLFAKVSDKDVVVDTASTLVSKMPRGKLIMLQEGVAIDMACGRDVIHCNLKHTLHLADETRDSINWTRVHGP